MNSLEPDDMPGPILHRQHPPQDSAREYFLGLLKKWHGTCGRGQPTFSNAWFEFVRDAARHWRFVFLSISSVLDDIDRGLSREEDIKGNLSAWRAVLGTCRYHLAKYQADLRASLKTFGAGPLGVPSYTLEEYHALLSVAKDLEERVERTLQYSTSSMSIVERSEEHTSELQSRP